MRICLGQITKNEEFFLGKFLPIIRECFDGYIVVDAESTDATPDIVRQFGGEVINRPWNNNYGAAKNVVIQAAETRGFHWIFILDADECLFAENIMTIKQYIDCTQETCFSVARIEFMKDDNHFRSNTYPDYQDRIFKLGEGYHYRGEVHEALYRNNEKAISFILPQCPIYHYGWTRDPKAKWLQWENIRRELVGLALLNKVPEGVTIDLDTLAKPYFGRKPI